LNDRPTFESHQKLIKVNKYLLITIIVVITQATFITKASNWEYKINNRITNDAVYLGNEIFLISKTLQLNTHLIGQTSNNSNNTYSVTKLDLSGNEINSVNITVRETLKGVLSNGSNTLYLIMESKEGTEISIKQFDTNLNLNHQAKFKIPESLNINQFDYDGNAMFLLGKDANTNMLQVVKLNAFLNVVWSKQLELYPADVSPDNEIGYDLKVTGQKIYITYNTSKVFQAIGMPPANENYTGVVVQMNQSGTLNWTKKVQYENTNYLSSRVHNIVKADQTGVWFTGTVNPLCFEGCPQNLVYKMDVSGNISQYITISPSFYNYVKDGFALNNNNIVFHGYSNDDVFGPSTPFSRNHIIVLSDLMAPVYSYSSAITQIDQAVLGQGENAFNKIISLSNNEVLLLSKGNTILKVDLSNPTCSDFQPHNDNNIFNLSFPGTTGISPLVRQVVNFTALPSYIPRLGNADLNLANKCFDGFDFKVGSDDQIMSIYPNPGKDKIYINTKLDEEMNYVIQNVEGRIVKNGILKSNVIDITELGIGMYYLKFLEDYANVPPLKIIKH